MFEVRARALTELEHRMALFPRNIDGLLAAAATNENGFGIHATQVRVLQILMKELVQRQRAFLDRLRQDVPDADFADGIDILLFEEMAGAHKVWSIFSRAFAARRIPEIAPQLDAADLVAAECYRLCMHKARNWGLLDADSMREPPLVCLETCPEPMAISRQELLGVLCDVGYRFHDLKLPIPLVLLPADHIECTWLLPTLCHEVGHNVDNDLGLSVELRQSLAWDGIAPARQAVWRQWTGEIVADAFGIMLGNAGFVQTITTLLLALGPGKRYQAPAPTSAHPHPRVRVPLIGAMLRWFGAPALDTLATRIEHDAQALPAPDELTPFLDEVDAVAGVLLGTKLAALGGHAMAEFCPNLAADLKQAQELADYLESGELRPSPDKPSRFPYRLVPVAAQLAVSARPLTPGRLAALQQRAMAFVSAIPRPPMLDGTARLTPGRAAFYARLAQDIHFGGRI
ncbi:MAG TPA: hypothetical protein VM694_38410 [Polyangium sp.]|nr:hypothetical protein [Polyangium sp.]